MGYTLDFRASIHKRNSLKSGQIGVSGLVARIYNSTNHKTAGTKSLSLLKPNRIRKIMAIGLHRVRPIEIKTEKIDQPEALNVFFYPCIMLNLRENRQRYEW